MNALTKERQSRERETDDITLKSEQSAAHEMMLSTSMYQLTLQNRTEAARIGRIRFQKELYPL